MFYLKFNAILFIIIDTTSHTLVYILVKGLICALKNKNDFLFLELKLVWNHEGHS